MQSTLGQLGELLLGSIPTIILFTLTFLGYRFIVHGALLRALEQRRSLTVGAVEKAQQDIASADAKTSQYEQRIREARVEIFRKYEERRHLWAEQRAAMTQEARKQSESRVQAARAAVEKEADAAKVEIQRSADGLAEQVMKAVLRTQPQTAGVER